MTNQEAFDVVWNHFVVGKGPVSMNDGAQCMYRGPNGAKCAAGLLVSDKVAEKIEGLGVGDAIHLHGNVFPAGVHVGVLKDLQRAHDESAADTRIDGLDFHRGIKKRLGEVANRHSLTIPA